MLMGLVGFLEILLIHTDHLFSCSHGGQVSGACTGYSSSLIHANRVNPFGVGFSFLFLTKRSRTECDSAVLVTSAGQAGLTENQTATTESAQN